MDDVVILWIEDNIQQKKLPESVPEYIRDEFDSRLGRAGRGRLWVSNELELPDDFEAQWSDSELCQKLGRTWGGIVVRREDQNVLNFDKLGFEVIITNKDIQRIE